MKYKVKGLPGRFNPDSLPLNVMFAAQNDFLNDSEFLKIDETKSLFSSGCFINDLDGSNDFSESRKILNEIVFGDRFFECGDENASLVFAFFFELSMVVRFVKLLNFCRVRLSQSNFDLPIVNDVLPFIETKLIDFKLCD